jgi:hypothetical protein
MRAKRLKRTKNLFYKCVLEFNLATINIYAVCTFNTGPSVEWGPKRSEILEDRPMCNARSCKGHVLPPLLAGAAQLRAILSTIQ